MFKASGWEFLARQFERMGARAVPHFITASVTFAALDQETPVVFKFADNSTDFIWTHGLYASDNAAVMVGNDLTFGGAVLSMSNIGGAGSLDNGDAMPIGALFGRDGVSGGAKALPSPFTFTGASNATIKVKNKVAGAQTIMFTMIGLRAVK